MNRTQIEYAHKRIDDLLRAKERDIASSFTKPAQAISDQERADLVRSGKVKLKADVSSISHYDDVAKVFDFSKFTWCDKIDQKAVDKAMKALRAEAQVLKDQIMLGDESTAMAALTVFAKKCGGE